MRSMLRRAATRWCCLGVLVLGGTAGVELLPSSVSAASDVSSRVLEWIRPAHDQPLIIYKGGTDNDQCTDQEGCASWAMRSQDGGRTWTDLGAALHLKRGSGGPVIRINSLTVTPDGRHVYVALSSSQPNSPDHSCSAVIVSSDGGRRWSSFDPSGEDCADGAGPLALVVSSVDASRLYEKDVTPGGEFLDTSLDGGKSIDQSNEFPNAAVSAMYADLFPDPTVRSGIYVYSYEEDDQGNPRKTRLFRSVDEGNTWAEVRPPAAAGSFRPVVDPREPGLLELRTGEPGSPTDLVYLSGDLGRSWRTATCPGVWHGECPNVTVDNVAGSGHAWAFVNNGIYTFDGSGPASARLAISARLPFAIPQLLDVEGGTHRGDPIYVLGKTAKAPSTRLYRSTDVGRSWRQIG